MLSVVLLTSTLIALAGARVYDRCELARDLQRLGVSRDQVSTWVCIAFHESRFNTEAWNTHSGDHGLLQISELYWCGPGKACGVTCSSLRDSDITNDIQCALRIYKEHTRLQGDGFMAWVVYSQYCRGNVNYIKDCNRLSKNYSEKLYNITPPLKESDVLNYTVPQFVDTGNINRPPPNYLAINSLIKAIDFDKFERDYYNKNKRKFDWQNFKIDNIDDLKLPPGIGLSHVELETPPTVTTHTTTTTARTTTTLDPALIGIKPPSPHKIESNQFRRKKMKFVQEPFKTENYSLNTTTVLSTSLPTTVITPRIVKDSELQDIYSYNSRLTTTSTRVPTTMKTMTTITATKTPQTTVKESPTQTMTTPVKPTTGTTSRPLGEANSFHYPDYTGAQKTTTEKSRTTGSITPLKRKEAFRGFRFYSSPSVSTASPKPVRTQNVLEENKNKIIAETSREPKNTFSYATYNVPNTTIQTSNDNQHIFLSSNTNTNTTSDSSIANATESSTIYKITNNILNKTSLINPQPSSRGKSRYSQTTTQKPIFSSPSSRTAAPQTTRSDLETSTASTTHSIFDLYLNPTRRPTLHHFSFAPFNKNPFRVRIFSGGTTPSP